jgi:type VI secretion system protein ImpH
LPTGDLCEPLSDFIFFYNGEQIDCDAELAIPAGEAEPIRLGRFGQLGWTTWMAPNWTSTDEYRRDARFHPAERMKHKRMRQAKPASRGGNHGGHQP